MDVESSSTVAVFVLNFNGVPRFASLVVDLGVSFLNSSDFRPLVLKMSFICLTMVSETDL